MSRTILLLFFIFSLSRAATPSQSPWLNPLDILPKVDLSNDCMKYECTSTNSFLDFAFKQCNTSVIQKIDYNELPSVSDVKDLMAKCLCGSADGGGVDIAALFNLCTRCLIAQQFPLTKLNDTWFNTACNCDEPHALDMLSGISPTCSRVKASAVAYRPNLNSGTKATGSVSVPVAATVAATTVPAAAQTALPTNIAAVTTIVANLQQTTGAGATAVGNIVATGAAKAAIAGSVSVSRFAPVAAVESNERWKKKRWFLF